MAHAPALNRFSSNVRPQGWVRRRFQCQTVRLKTRIIRSDSCHSLPICASSRWTFVPCPKRKTSSEMRFTLAIYRFHLSFERAERTVLDDDDLSKSIPLQDEFSGFFVLIQIALQKDDCLIAHRDRTPALNSGCRERP